MERGIAAPVSQFRDAGFACVRINAAHACCGQVVGWIKTPLGMESGLRPGRILLDADPAPPLWQGAHQPHFSADVYYGPMSGWIRIPRGTEVSLDPGDILCQMGDQFPPRKGGQFLDMVSVISIPV